MQHRLRHWLRSVRLTTAGTLRMPAFSFPLDRGRTRTFGDRRPPSVGGFPAFVNCVADVAEGAADHANQHDRNCSLHQTDFQSVVDHFNPPLQITLLPATTHSPAQTCIQPAHRSLTACSASHSSHAMAPKNAASKPATKTNSLKAEIKSVSLCVNSLSSVPERRRPQRATMTKPRLRGQASGVLAMPGG